MPRSNSKGGSVGRSPGSGGRRYARPSNNFRQGRPKSGTPRQPVAAPSSADDVTRLATFRARLEFLFSDSNLDKDSHFRALIEDGGPGGFVSLATIATFKRFAVLRADADVLAQAVPLSPVLRLSADRSSVASSVSRVSHPPAFYDERTVYVEQLPLHSHPDSLAAYFSTFGCVTYVSMPRFRTHKRRFKGYAFVEFDSISSAAAAVAFHAAQSAALTQQLHAVATTWSSSSSVPAVAATVAAPLAVPQTRSSHHSVGAEVQVTTSLGSGHITIASDGAASVVEASAAAVATALSAADPSSAIIVDDTHTVLRRKRRRGIDYHDSDDDDDDDDDDVVGAVGDVAGQPTLSGSQPAGSEFDVSLGGAVAAAAAVTDASASDDAPSGLFHPRNIGAVHAVSAHRAGSKHPRLEGGSGSRGSRGGGGGAAASRSPDGVLPSSSSVWTSRHTSAAVPSLPAASPPSASQRFGAGNVGHAPGRDVSPLDRSSIGVDNEDAGGEGGVDDAALRAGTGLATSTHDTPPVLSVAAHGLKRPRNTAGGDAVVGGSAGGGDAEFEFSRPASSVRSANRGSDGYSPLAYHGAGGEVEGDVGGLGSGSAHRAAGQSVDAVFARSIHGTAASCSASTSASELPVLSQRLRPQQQQQQQEQRVAYDPEVDTGGTVELMEVGSGSGYADEDDDTGRLPRIDAGCEAYDPEQHQQMQHQQMQQQRHLQHQQQHPRPSHSGAQDYAPVSSNNISLASSDGGRRGSSSSGGIVLRRGGQEWANDNNDAARAAAAAAAERSSAASAHDDDEGYPSGDDGGGIGGVAADEMEFYEDSDRDAGLPHSLRASTATARYNAGLELDDTGGGGGGSGSGSGGRSRTSYRRRSGSDAAFVEADGASSHGRRSRRSSFGGPTAPVLTDAGGEGGGAASQGEPEADVRFVDDDSSGEEDVEYDDGSSDDGDSARDLGAMLEEFVDVAAAPPPQLSSSSSSARHRAASASPPSSAEPQGRHHQQHLHRGIHLPTSVIPTGTGTATAAARGAVTTPGAGRMVVIWKAEWTRRKEEAKAALRSVRDARRAALAAAQVAVSVELAPFYSSSGSSSSNSETMGTEVGSFSGAALDSNSNSRDAPDSVLVPLPASAQSSSSVSFSTEPPLAVAGATSATANTTTTTTTTAARLMTFPHGVLLLLSGVPVTTPFSVLRDAVTPGGRPAYIDAERIFSNGLGGGSSVHPAPARADAAARAVATAAANADAANRRNIAERMRFDVVDLDRGGPPQSDNDEDYNGIDVAAAGSTPASPSSQTTTVVVRYHTPEDARRAFDYFASPAAGARGSSSSGISGGGRVDTSRSRSASMHSTAVADPIIAAAAAAAAAAGAASAGVSLPRNESVPSAPSVGVSFPLCGAVVCARRLGGAAEAQYWARVRDLQAAARAAKQGRGRDRQ